MSRTKLFPKTPEGLTDAEAKRRLEVDGFNELPSSRKRSVFAIALSVAKEPMLFLLVACGVIYLFLGSTEDAVMLLGSSFIVIGITFAQERKTERTLEALKDLTSPRALVIRDGVRRRIPGREVAIGDLVLITEGDRVPADVAVLSASHLTVDESLLTGEALPVSKSEWDGVQTEGRPGGDAQPFAYSGTLVVGGKALCRVLQTGVHSEVGKIGKSLQQIDDDPSTNVQKETMHFVRVFFVIGVILCFTVTVVYAYTQGNFLKGILAGIALAMSMLPEEFPVVLTIFLALGAWRISRQGVLTRRVPAVEMLGSATVLCVDKTGTLTENRMSVRRMVSGDFAFSVEEKTELPEKYHKLLEFGILASQKDPFDPMEKAFRDLGQRVLRGTEHLHADWRLLREYPLSAELMAMSEVWQSSDESAYVIASKGSPEAIIDLCHLSESEAERIMREVRIMADDGLRVLAVAAAHEQGNLPDLQHDFSFRFLGLLGLADPVRKRVPEAIAECRTAGIRVIMMTGDHPQTAVSVARAIGLPVEDGSVITGPEMETLPEAELFRRIKTASVFARVVPEQKLLLVNALKALGEVVAMTGDGVNDAPALKAANIGIAMGGRGTDVAREAADLVLVRDDFSSIVSAIRVGRRIFDNLKKAMSYVIAVHIPIAGLSLIPVLFRWPLVLLPVHIMFLEMIIDPACSVVFEMESEERGIMHRPPRRSDEKIFSAQRLIVSAMQGVSVLIICLLVFLFAKMNQYPEGEIRALTFTTLIVANIGLILANRSWTRTIIENFRSKNVAVWWVTGGALLFLFFVLSFPFLRELFRFEPLSILEFFSCIAAGIFSILWFEGMKFFFRGRIV